MSELINGLQLLKTDQNYMQTERVANRLMSGDLLTQMCETLWKLKDIPGDTGVGGQQCVCFCAGADG